MAEKTLIAAINQALDQCMEKDPTVVMLGEDVGVDGGVFRATDGLIKKYGEKRVMDTPIAEAGIVGASVGMAVAGIKPVAEIQFSGFIYPAYQEIVSHVARIRYRTRGRFTCPMVIRAPYGGGIRALEHHSESLESVYAHVPGIKVVIPSNPYNAKGLLIAAINDPDPVIFLEPKRLYRAFRQEVPDEMYEVEIGKARIDKPGEHLTVIAWGAMIPVARDAINDWEEESGKTAELIDLQSIYPWDVNCVIDSVKKTGRCVVVHEATKTLGFASEIIATINDKALLHLEAPVARVCGYDTPFPLFQREEYYIPDPLKVRMAIDKTMNF